MKILRLAKIFVIENKVNESIDKETFYEKYFGLFWYALGYIVALSQLSSPASIEKTASSPDEALRNPGR